MLALKMRRLRLDVRSRFSHLTERVDQRIRIAFANVRTFFSYFNRKSAVALLQWIAYHILSWARQAYIWMHRKAHAHPKSKKVIDMVRGRGEVEKKGGASFYLKRISEETPSATK